jgi:hypothetical protein
MLIFIVQNKHILYFGNRNFELGFILEINYLVNIRNRKFGIRNYILIHRKKMVMFTLGD